MATPLNTQRVVITGAGQGLGAAIARAFAVRGAELVLLDISGESLDTVNNQIGGTAMTITTDLADADQTNDAIQRISSGAPIDCLIHNAAILRPEPLEDVSLDTFRATLDVGIQAGFQLAKAFWPSMKSNGGAVAFVSSQSGIKGFADETAYCAAKHALEGFMKCLALEGEGRDILSCTVTPGKPMHTPMSESNYPPELKKQWVEPDLLTPAFIHIAERHDLGLNGQRLDAWALSERIKDTL